MKKVNRNKSTSSSTVSTANIMSICSKSDLELFSSYSHEQVHIYDKLCSSISSSCEIAYCTSEGITICVPQTYQRQLSSSQNLSSSSSSLSSIVVARIEYPFESNDQINSISMKSTSSFIFEKLKDKHLSRLYEAYKRRPTSLSSFDRFLCNDTIKYKGFRRCLFSPFDIRLNQGQTILATITCAHEVFIYEIISSSKRFFLSQSSNLKIDLTKCLFENIQLENYLQDTNSEDDYRLLYFHLTSHILWNQTGTLLFQLQYSGHIIIWKFYGSTILNEKSLSIIDTKINKPLTMIWNEQSQILLIIGKENQRVLIKLDQMKLFSININHHNDYMNTEYAQLIQWNKNTSLLVESKINYCLIYTILTDENQPSTYNCNQVGYRILPSPIVGFQEEQYSSSSSMNHISILIGCEDGSIHCLIISRELPLNIIDMKLVASGQMKSCSRKPLLLRHFNLSPNELLLARIFYSPIVAPNVKFGFVLCTLHRWLSNTVKSMENIIENFLERIDIPLWRSFDEVAILLNEITHNTNQNYQIKKQTNQNLVFLQRVCRLCSLLNNTKQLEIYENQLLKIYRYQFWTILNSLFSKMMNKLTPFELLIYTICSNDQQIYSSTLFMCPMCNTSLTILADDLLFSTCSNKHIWPRCCRTLLPLSFDSAQTCSLCDRTIILIETYDKNYSNFLQYKDHELNILFSSICTFCM
ncbi:unnamed protein product [Rotaria socialis]|uniref:Transcription factor IIIC putative zinc-finger domain-containing protein n=1 Tax=Rotaria socialis TaxID=392032 RepID=A0A817ZL35_9BILA|nr:unnamed protein product [Rotaria socialis]CAF4149413.1 unnamed protein product [Rotaria socialis]